MKNNWLERNSKNIDYIRLNAGLMTVDEINSFLNSTSVLSFVDQEKKLRYYKQPLNLNYSPDEIGQELGTYLEDSDEAKKINRIFDKLKDGEKVIYESNSGNTKTHFIIDSYYRMEDKSKDFSGMAIESQDIYPLIKFYLEKTGQKLVDDPNNPRNILETDADTGASEEWT
ncbi:PAS domain-containing protein [Lactobacillus sp.]|uniref:PAS domain-containing protein n=1 Tax=Lactobacillus sp. TaxID=1591 RepID=UPI0019CC1712|nr:PAS domain-containing protein [Lactobacillus sp.]MBD5430708.1 oxidoreductase [Lactobacillus sp.]